MYRDIPEDFKALIEPVIDEHGLELVDLEIAGGKGMRILRVTLDTPVADGRVDIDRCAEVSREIGTLLDASGIIKTAYQLEVSSPGLNRKLAREKDFTAACGSKVQLETKRAVAGRRRFRGVLKQFDGEVALVETEEGEVELPFVDMAKASTVYEFSSADFESARSKDRSERRQGSGRKERGRPRNARERDGEKSED